MTQGPSVRHNVVANFLGKGWSSILSLAFVPIYIRLLGVEVYGLLGIFVSLGAMLSLLDMGLSSTLSRALSRLSVVNGAERESRNLVRTFSTVYWIVGILMGAAVFAFAPVITRHWINLSGVDSETVEMALRIMGASIAMQWPVSIYASALMGIQRQVALNVIRSAMVTVQHGGSVLVLLYVSQSILAFFLWHAFVGLLTTVAHAVWLGRSLPNSPHPVKFDRNLLAENWRFAAGMTGISVLVIILTQLDKIILSKMLALEMFGYYMLAFNIANVLVTLGNPVFTALFPKLSQLVAEEDPVRVAALYHKGCQFIALVVLPVAATLAFFSKEVLAIWIGTPAVVDNTHALLSLLLVGTAINAVMSIPYALMLSFGWTRLVFMQNLISIVFLVPLMIWLIGIYNGVGAGIVWIILNAGYVFILVPIMHQRILRSEMKKWYVLDFGAPIAVVLLVGCASRMCMPTDLPAPLVFFWIGTAYLLQLLLLVLLFPLTRNILALNFRKRIFRTH